ncbi:MAG: amino acid ABC transporter permease [Candidatus Lokiarchaeota archaeon]|nr:amino acid ABC transporter permease [Candidatus Lokiarchaeota archaeon]
MLFQTELDHIGMGIVNSILIFLISIYIIRWYSRKKNVPSIKQWDISFNKNIKVSLVWLIINISIAISFSLFIKNIRIYFLTQVCVYILSDIFIGTFIVRNIYKIKLAESFKFVFVIQLILFGISFILGYILAIIFGYLFPEISDAVFFVLEFGLLITLLITALSLIFGFVIGLTLAIMRVYGGKELYWLAGGYEKLFRGIPLLVLIFIFAFGLPGIFWYLEPLDRLLASVILALGIRSGAYQSQIFRGAILSVNPGQMEAARSLGMNKIKSFRYIVLPQALRIAIPGWSNEYSVVIKDTSFAGAIGTFEMTFAAYIWGFRSVELFTLSMGVVAVLYFLFTFPVTNLFGKRQTEKLKKLGMGGG